MKDESEAVVMLKPYLNKATVQVFINEQSLAAAGIPLWSGVIIITKSVCV